MHLTHNMIFSYKSQYDLITEKNGDTLQLYSVEGNKVNLVSAIDIYEDDEAELLLCYNRKQTSRQSLFDYSYPPRSHIHSTSDPNIQLHLVSAIGIYYDDEAGPPKMDQ